MQAASDLGALLRHFPAAKMAIPSVSPDARSCHALEVLLNPSRELLSGKRTRCKSDDDLFLFIDRRGKFEAIHDQGDFECSVRDAFVAVDKWMVADQEEPEGGSFRRNRRIELSAIKGLMRLSD